MLMHACVWVDGNVYVHVLCTELGFGLAGNQGGGVGSGGGILPDYLSLHASSQQCHRLQGCSMHVPGFARGAGRVDVLAQNG